jgi:hypothetical protein
MKRLSVVLVLFALLSLSACVSIVGGPGGISPEQFQFQPVVPLREAGPGGWKSARVTIHLLHVTDLGVEKTVLCPIEVQVPEINGDGVVTDAFAQWEAARASDIAAERTLRQEGLLSAEMCQRFIDELMYELGKSIGGTRVIKAR